RPRFSIRAEASPRRISFAAAGAPSYAAMSLESWFDTRSRTRASTSSWVCHRLMGPSPRSFGSLCMLPQERDGNRRAPPLSRYAGGFDPGWAGEGGTHELASWGNGDRTPARAGIPGPPGVRPGPRYFFSLSAATPGSTLPSRYSSDAPPPVDTCDTLPATPAFFTADAESPLLLMVVAPAAVALASASATAIVPLAVASISNTPTGPFQTIVLAPSRIFSNAAVVSGPMSTHSQSAGMVVRVTTLVAPTVRPLKSSLSVATKSVPSTSFSPASARRLFASSILSFSTIDLPVSSPCAFRKV